MIKVFIGPNGFGKTTKLNEERERLINSNVPQNEILFLESEIMLMDEVKDTKDESKTMEFIIQELFMNSRQFIAAKTNFEDQVNVEINNNKQMMNNILDNILSLNQNTRSPNTDFISSNPKISYKNIVKIDSKELKTKTGSGQRMQLILELANYSSSKKYIFLDEPEKYSHPSLLHKTARIIENLNSNGADVYIATHSPKLISMLDISFDNLFIINDSSHVAKQIDFPNILSQLQFRTVGSMKNKEKSFYFENSLKENIKNLYYRDFLEALFSKKVFLCEGVNDRLFLLKALRTDGKLYDDYSIFQTFGKFVMPVFEKIFSSLGIETQVFFDEDTAKRTTDLCHQEIDNYLEQLNNYEFKPDIETEIGFQLSGKYEIVDFVDYLEKQTLIKNKYIS